MTNLVGLSLDSVWGWRTSSPWGLAHTDHVARRGGVAFRLGFAVSLCSALIGCSSPSDRERGAEVTAKSEVVGLREFQRNCASCHVGAPTFAPPLSKSTVEGREDYVLGLIMNGGARMPSFQHMLDDAAAKRIVSYMKTMPEPAALLEASSPQTWKP